MYITLIYQYVNAILLCDTFKFDYGECLLEAIWPRTSVISLPRWLCLRKLLILKA